MPYLFEIPDTLFSGLTVLLPLGAGILLLRVAFRVKSNTRRGVYAGIAFVLLLWGLVGLAGLVAGWVLF